MKCPKCNKEILVNEYHDCHVKTKAEKVVKKLMPPIRRQSNYNYVKKVEPIILSPDFTLLSVQELNNLKNQGNGVLPEIKRIVKSIQETLKSPTLQNVFVFAVALASILLWIITSYNANYNYMPATGLKGLLAIAFGSYNNVFARVIHFSSVYALLSVFIPQLMKKKSISITGISQSVKHIKNTLKDKKSKVFGFFVMALGLSYILGNFMMRNNSHNKYLACLTFGLSVLLATKELKRTSFIRLLKALLYDLKKLLKIKSSKNKYGDIIRQGLGFGLVSTFILGFLRKILPYSMGDKIGYLLGGLIVVVGLYLIISGKETHSEPGSVSHDQI